MCCQILQCQIYYIQLQISNLPKFEFALQKVILLCWIQSSDTPPGQLGVSQLKPDFLSHFIRVMQPLHTAAVQSNTVIVCCYCLLKGIWSKRQHKRWDIYNINYYLWWQRDLMNVVSVFLLTIFESELNFWKWCFFF